MVVDLRHQDGFTDTVPHGIVPSVRVVSRSFPCAWRHARRGMGEVLVDLVALRHSSGHLAFRTSARPTPDDLTCEVAPEGCR
jgi:hypothetical protein